LAAILGAPYVGIISTFACLNTVSDLPQFAEQAARVLRPQVRALVHLLNRFSLWEWLGLIGRGQISAARSLGRSPECSFHISGYANAHLVWSLHGAYQAAFRVHFGLRGDNSLGALRPPPPPRRLPESWVRGLGWLGGRLVRYAPLLNWGRFFVLELERR